MIEEICLGIKITCESKIERPNRGAGGRGGEGVAKDATELQMFSFVEVNVFKPF